MQEQGQTPPTTELSREELLKLAALKKVRELAKERFALRLYQPHAKQLAFHQATKRLRFFFAGNRVGKSWAGAVEACWFALGRHPFRPKLRAAGGWIVSPTFEVQREVSQEMFLRFLPKENIRQIAWRDKRRGYMDYVLLRTGPGPSVKVVFKSAEQGREAFQGSSVRWIWIDEECPMDVFEECQMRTLDCQGDIWGTMTPIIGELYQHIADRSASDPEVFYLHASWDDNPHLTEGEKKRLLETMRDDEVQARVHGQYVIPGGTVFRQEGLLDRRNVLLARQDSVQRRRFEGGRWETCSARDGVLEVYKEPEDGAFYVIGADVAEGLPSGDNSVACVVDADTAEQVAELCCREEPDTFAAMLDALGRWYNNAEMVVERNNAGQAVLLALDTKLLYPALYKHSDERLGWPETAKTRPVAVAAAQEMVREHPETINSLGLIAECRTFVRSATGRPQALGKGRSGGCKDDRVFAWAMALLGRELVGPPLDAVLPRRRAKTAGVAANGSWSHPSLEEDEDVQPVSYTSWNPTVWVDYDA